MKSQVIAKVYANYLHDSSITVQSVNDKDISSYHLYGIRLNKKTKNANNQRVVYNHMHKHGIKVNIHYIPIHLQPFYSRLGFERGDFPEAEKYYNECISLPIYPTLKREEIVYVCDQILEVVS